MEKMSFRDLLDIFSIPLEVYFPKDGKTGHHDDLGIWVEDPLESIQVNEPFIPAGPNAFESTTGGTIIEYDRQWFSTHDVPLKSKVKNLASDETFEVVNAEPWNDYSDVFIYRLKAVGNE
ncbi:hypothetical protein [Lentilactobacillus senioris]|uniref:hypothetical protein n=1 Tax=Lentilactobacillus senioris TaxID=931534 RepID=UPI003D2C4642